MQDRQRERGGLAGAGLRNADDVAAAHRERDRLGLDRGGSDVVLFGKRERNGIGEAEILKGSQKGSFYELTRAPARIATVASEALMMPACLEHLLVG